MLYYKLCLPLCPFFPLPASPVSSSDPCTLTFTSGPIAAARSDRADVDPGIQVQMQIEAHFVSDVLRGDDTTEMRVSLIRYIEDEMPPEED